MVSTIGRLLAQLRWSTLQTTLTDLANRLTSMEAGYKTEIEVLWSGVNGTAGQVSVLSRNLRPGDVLFLQHNDAATLVTYESPVKEITSGYVLRFLAGGSVYTACSIGATPDRLTFNSFTNGYAINAICALRIVKK